MKILPLVPSTSTAPATVTTSSFTAQMIVSADDIAPDILGIQNVWTQGVGGASAAIANFSS